MLHKKIYYPVFLFMGMFIYGSNAFACGECEYADSLGVCWPYDKCVVKQINPVTQVQNIIKLGQAVASGDPKQITQSVGNVLINSPNCLGCASVAHTILPNLTDAQIQTAIGQGFFTFVASGDPVLVVIDVATNIATQQDVKVQDTPFDSGNPQPNPSRQQQTYTATAQCMIKGKDGIIYAAWTDPATFIDTKGQSHIYPSVDLVAGDTVSLTAPDCPAWNNPSTGQISITSATMKFDKVSSKSGGASVLKWIIYGAPI